MTQNENKEETIPKDDLEESNTQLSNEFEDEGFQEDDVPLQGVLINIQEVWSEKF